MTLKDVLTELALGQKCIRGDDEPFLCTGYGITGAGGGGFLVLLAKDAGARSAIEERLAQTPVILYPSQVAT